MEGWIWALTRGCEGTDGTSDFVQNVYYGIHVSKTLDVTTDDVSRDDTTNEFDHAVSESRYNVHWEQTGRCNGQHHRSSGTHNMGFLPVGIPVAIVCYVVCCLVLEFTAGGSIDNEEDRRDEAEHEDGCRAVQTFSTSAGMMLTRTGSQDGASGKSFNEGSDDDGAYTLGCSVHAGENACVWAVMSARGLRNII
jgi:hypothetical protein